MASKQEDDATKEMNEDMDNAKEEEKCMPKRMPKRKPKCMPFKFWKFIFTGIGGTTLDVATDIYQCFKHFR